MYNKQTHEQTNKKQTNEQTNKQGQTRKQNKTVKLTSDTNFIVHSDFRRFRT